MWNRKHCRVNKQTNKLTERVKNQICCIFTWQTRQSVPPPFGLSSVTSWKWPSWGKTPEFQIWGGGASGDDVTAAVYKTLRRRRKVSASSPSFLSASSPSFLSVSSPSFLPLRVKWCHDLKWCHDQHRLKYLTCLLFLRNAATHLRAPAMTQHWGRWWWWWWWWWWWRLSSLQEDTSFLWLCFSPADTKSGVRVEC